MLFRHPEVAAQRPSKGDGRAASAGILRGSLRSHLRMTDQRQSPGSRHKEAEPVEKRAARMAVRGHAVAELQLADVVAQIEIKMPVEIGDLVAEACELSLQRDALGARRLDI